MPGRVIALIVKELYAVWRDPKGRTTLIVPPLLQLVIFSFAATLEVRNVELAVLDHDAGRWGHELVQRLEGSRTFTRVFHITGEPQIREVIDNRRALAVVHIGPAFSRALEAGRPARLQVIFDGRRSNAGQIVQGYLGRMVDVLAADAAAGRGSAPVTDAVVGRNWFNANLDYMWYTVPSLIGVITLLIGIMVTGLSVARERELGTFEQLLVSPLRLWEILIGKMIPPLIIGLTHASVYVLVAMFVFGVPFRGSVTLLYASLVLYLAAVIGVGLFISALSQTQQQAILGAFFFGVPAVLLSGFATPVENMPAWLQHLTLANPVRHVLVVIKGVFLKDMPAEAVLANVWPLAVIAVVTLVTATALFRSRME